MTDNESNVVDIKAKAKELEERIKAAKSDNQVPFEKPQPETPEADTAPSKGARAGSEFLANVFAGGLIGFGIDWFFKTQPWGMLFFLIMGFVSAVFRANAAMKDE